MNSFALFAVTLLATSTLTSAEVKNCAGFEDAPLVVLDGTSPDVIYLDSVFQMSTKTVLSQDMPSDLQLGLALTMTDPFPLDVPCIDGLGSW